MLDHYKEFPVHGLTTWFSEMAAIADNSTDSSSLPKLELLLRSGSVVRGHILKLRENNHDQFLMIASLKDQYNSNSEVTFISAHEVVALTLLEPEAYLKQYVLPAASKSIGSLELKRAAREFQESIQQFFQEEVLLELDAKEYPDNTRWEVLQVLESLPAIMEQITADELGKKLVNEKIKRIEIGVSDHSNTALENGSLKLYITSPFSGTLNSEKERIKNDIEGLL